jgi:hypothetical protein
MGSAQIVKRDAGMVGRYQFPSSISLDSNSASMLGI